MRPRINVITLAVSDLDRALEFYREGLGLDSPGVIGGEYTGDDTTPAGVAAMFQLEGELTLALYPRAELAKDARVPPEAAEDRRVQHRPYGRQQVRCRRFAHSGRARRCDGE
jgi:uncharacterized protein